MPVDPIQRLQRELDRLGEAATAISAALDGPPSAWDRAALRAVAWDLGERSAVLATAASRVRRAREVDDGRATRLEEQARSGMAIAPDMAEAIGRLLEQGPKPLIEPVDPHSTRTRAMGLLSRGFSQIEKAVTETEQSPEMEANSYPFIPLDAASFVAGLQAGWRILAAQGRIDGARFLDIGAGAGSKLVLAGQVFSEAEGIELDPIYLAQAPRVMTVVPGIGQVHAQDALTFERYGDYAMIYLYCPLSNTALENALEARILAQARPGTVIFAPRVRDTLLQRQAQIAPGLVVTGLDAAELAALRQEAELIGAAAPPTRRRKGWNRRNPLLPAMQALWRAGFGV